MKYLKAEWKESLGGHCDSWESSVWFFELDESNYPIPQVTVFSNSIRLKYDRSNIEGQYGSLGDQSIDPQDDWGHRINKQDFEKEWKTIAHNSK